MEKTPSSSAKDEAVAASLPSVVSHDGLVAQVHSEADHVLPPHSVRSGDCPCVFHGLLHYECSPDETETIGYSRSIFRWKAFQTAYLRFMRTFLYIGWHQLLQDISEPHTSFSGTSGVIMAAHDLVARRLTPSRLLDIN
jgi:hypothetical protein